MIDASEFDFGRKLDKARYLSRPRLWSFALRYGLGIGWLCTIQESSFTEVHTGTGQSWVEAMDAAIEDLKRTRENDNKTD